VIHYPAADTPGAVARTKRVFVFAHGAGAGERHPFMVTIARGLADRAIDVVTFEFPYMQQKRKVPDKAPVLESAFREAIAEARTRVTPEHALVIGGKSMGGRMATHLAAQKIEAVRGVVALGYPLHPPGRPEQPRVAHLPDIEMPILIVQGERDAFGTPAELRPVFRSLRAPVTLHVVEGGDHSLATRARSGPHTYAGVLETVARWIHDV
jgi:uncharacterized protein